MIKFDRAAGNQSVMAPDAPAMTFPNGDWAVGFVVGFLGVTTGNNPQYLLSTGNFGASASFNACYFTSGYDTPSQAGKIAIYSDTQTTSASALTSANTFSEGHYVFVIQRSGGAITLRSCRITGSARSAADVIAEGSHTGSNFLVTLNGVGLRIGSRLDDLAARKSDQAQGRTFLITNTLTNAEVARLANGEEITALGKTVAYYSRMSSVSDVADQGPNAVAFSVAGSPTTSAEPPYPSAGEPPDEEPPVVENTISVTAPAAERIFQRIGAAADVPLTGAYAGAQPAAIEYRLYAEDGATAVTGWIALDAAIGAGAWSATASIAQGGKFRVAVRSKASDAAVLATSEPVASKFAVGDIFGVIGSSSAEKLFDSTSGSGYTAAPNTSKLSGSPATWVTMSTLGAGTLFAAGLAAKSGVPVGMLDYGVGGTTLAQWLTKTNTSWTRFAAAVAAAGGKLAAVYVTVGSNDANASSITSRAAHLMNMRALVANVRELTGQPDLPVLWSGSNNRPALAAVQANRLRMAECDIGGDTNVWHVQTTDFAISADNIHLTPAGFAASVQRTAYVLGEALYSGSYRRGPAIAVLEYLGAEVFATIAHGGGSDIAPSSGATGFAVSDGAGAVAVSSVERLDSTHLRLVLVRAVTAPVSITYQADGAPNISSPVFDNGTPALPMLVETDLAATERAGAADTTAPVMTGSVAVSNVTTAGATLIWPAATDDVAVAGYEYSTNGGASYTSTGAARTVTLTGLAAATTYAVRVRAYDVAGNRASPLTSSFTTGAEAPPVADAFDATKVAAARKVVFPGGTRVVVFGGGPGATYPNGPYQRDGRWMIDKHPMDEFYCVADISFDLAESQTTALSVIAVVGGVKVLEAPVIQGALVPVKIGDLDEAQSAQNFCTLRISLANGEQIDRTIWFAKNQGVWKIAKDPDDKRYFVADVSNILADSNTQIAAALKAVPVGVTVIDEPVAQGDLLMVKLGGLDVSADPLNHCTLPFTCANGEKFFRTIHFNRVDN